MVFEIDIKKLKYELINGVKIFELASGNLLKVTPYSKLTYLRYLSVFE